MASSHSNISSWTWEDYHRCVHGYLDTFQGNISAETLVLYPDGVETPEYQYTTLTTDVRITCPTNIMADILSTYFKSPVYRYVLQQRPSYPVETEAGIQFKARYSYHNWDSVGFFGIISDYYTPTKEDRIYEQMIQREILHFARTGKPYTDNWKTYPTNIGLLDANVTVVNSYHAEMCKFWDDNNFFSYGWVN
jgi:carboxylesterase type B